MIKTNLLKTRVNMGGVASQEYTFESAGESSNQREQLTKFVLIIFGTVCLIVYQYIHVGGLEDELSGLQVQSQKLNTELAELKSKTGNVEEVQKEIKRSQEKIDLVEEYFGKRLKELKALDYLQNVIPDGVWLESFNYDGEKAKIVGSAITDRDLNSFVEKLEMSQNFQNVLLVSSQTDENAAGTFKKFELDSVIGEEK